MAERQLVRTLKVDATDTRQIQEQIVHSWHEIIADPAIRKKAIEKGLDPSILDGRNPPFTAERPGDQFGISGAVLIWLSGVAAEHFVGKGVDWLWDDVIWPRIRQKFGNKVKSGPAPRG